MDDPGLWDFMCYARDEDDHGWVDDLVTVLDAVNQVLQEAAHAK